MAHVDQRWLLVKEACEILRMTPQTFRRLVKDGQIKVIKGTHRHSPWKVERRELDTYIERVKREGNIRDTRSNLTLDVLIVAYKGIREVH